jgi:hypothetical protein
MQSARGERRAATFALPGLVLTLVLAVGVSAAGVSAKDAKPRQTLKQLRLLEDTAGTNGFWAPAAKPKRVAGKKVAVRAAKYRPLKLDAKRLGAVLARAHTSAPPPRGRGRSSSPCLPPTARFSASPCSSPR